MLREIRTGTIKIDAILVDTFERFGRADELAALRQELYQQHGVLILSRFAGAARELPEALVVNPYDIEAVAATLGGSRCVVFFTREGLVGLDPATGAVRFSKRWRARFDTSVNAAVP